MVTVCFNYTCQELKSLLLFLFSSYLFFFLDTPQIGSVLVSLFFKSAIPCCYIGFHCYKAEVLGKEKPYVSSMIRTKSSIEPELSISLPLPENLKLDFLFPQFG